MQNTFLLLEGGGYLLLEGGGRIILEELIISPDTCNPTNWTPETEPLTIWTDTGCLAKVS